MTAAPLQHDDIRLRILVGRLHGRVERFGGLAIHGVAPFGSFERNESDLPAPL
jgi:hypothetical protein